MVEAVEAAPGALADRLQASVWKIELPGADEEALLRAAGASPAATYGVFSCADNLDGEPSKGGAQSPGQYYESLGRADLFHPLTLIAYAMNGAPLPVQNGAPFMA